MHTSPAVYTQRTMSFRGGELRVTQAGAAPAAGYLHGLLGHPAEPPVAGLLAARGIGVVAPNLPGFGSPACAQLRTVHDWVVALSEIVDSCGLAGKPVIASSLGAMLALELAAVRPGVFAALVLVGPLGLWDPSAPVADLFATTVREERALLTQDVARTAEFYEDRAAADPSQLIEHSVVRYVARSTAASLLWPLPEFGLAGRLYRVACPVTLVWGASDRLVPSSYLERFAMALPNTVSKTVVPEAGHLADWDCPEAIANIALEAFARAQ